MSDDLKPCPFCGGKAELSNSVVSCMFCLCCLPDGYGHEGNAIGFETEAKAIIAWNTRTKPLVDRLFDQQIADYVKHAGCRE